MNCGYQCIKIAYKNGLALPLVCGNLCQKFAFSPHNLAFDGKVSDAILIIYEVELNVVGSY